MLVFTVFLEEKVQIVNKIKAAHTNVFENLKEKKANCESSEKKTKSRC